MLAELADVHDLIPWLVELRAHLLACFGVHAAPSLVEVVEVREDGDFLVAHQLVLGLLVAFFGQCSII